MGLGFHYAGGRHWSKWLYSFLFVINILVIFIDIFIYRDNIVINRMGLISVHYFFYPLALLNKFKITTFIYHFVGLTYWLVGFLDLAYFLFKKDLQLLRTIYLSILIFTNFFWIFQVSHYDKLNDFSEGLSIVTSKGKYGFINQMGIKVISLQYDNANDFSEGLAVVRKDNLWGFIDHRGKEVIPIQYKHG